MEPESTQLVADPGESFDGDDSSPDRDYVAEHAPRVPLDDETVWGEPIPTEQDRSAGLLSNEKKLDTNNQEVLKGQNDGKG